MIRITHILIAMGLILLAGVLGAKHLEDQMGVSAVPGLVLLNCPDLGASSLERLGTRWEGATLERVAADTVFFHPFDAGFVTQRGKKGDAVALFSISSVRRSDPEIASWSVVLDGFPGAKLPQRAAGLAEAVEGFMQGQSGSRSFLVGINLDPGLSQSAILQVVERLLEAARTYPPSRRTAVVLLGAGHPDSLTGRLTERWCLRIPVGDWSHRQQAGLRDLLDADQPLSLEAAR